VSFGLLEMRERPGGTPLSRRYKVRKTALYDRFIRFDLDESDGAGGGIRRAR